MNDELKIDNILPEAEGKAIVQDNKPLIQTLIQSMNKDLNILDTQVTHFNTGQLVSIKTALDELKELFDNNRYLKDGALYLGGKLITLHEKCYNKVRVNFQQVITSIIINDKKNEETIVSLQKQLDDTKTELDNIKSELGDGLKYAKCFNTEFAKIFFKDVSEEMHKHHKAIHEQHTEFYDKLNIGLKEGMLKYENMMTVFDKAWKLSEENKIGMDAILARQEAEKTELARLEAKKAELEGQQAAINNKDEEKKDNNDAVSKALNK